VNMRLLVQCADGTNEPASHRLQRIPQVHPDQGRDLVVARPARPQSAAELRAQQLNKTALERAVDIFIGPGRLEDPRGNLSRQGIEAVDHCGKLVFGEQPRLA